MTVIGHIHELGMVSIDMGTDDSENGGSPVLPLEHTAYFPIDHADGYVDIEQSILEAADAAASEQSE